MTATGWRCPEPVEGKAKIERSAMEVNNNRFVH